MLSELVSGKHVTGVKQSRKAVADGRAVKIFLARDADPAVTEPLENLCGERNVPFEYAGTMAEIGASCGISIGAAVAALTK
jgi:large subunit ribosomal protein L7A